MEVDVCHARLLHFIIHLQPSALALSISRLLITMLMERLFITSPALNVQQMSTKGLTPHQFGIAIHVLTML